MWPQGPQSGTVIEKEAKSFERRLNFDRDITDAKYCMMRGVGAVVVNKVWLLR